MSIEAEYFKRIMQESRERQFWVEKATVQTPPYRPASWTPPRKPLVITPIYYCLQFIGGLKNGQQLFEPVDNYRNLEEGAPASFLVGPPPGLPPGLEPQLTTLEIADYIPTFVPMSETADFLDEETQLVILLWKR